MVLIAFLLLLSACAGRQETSYCPPPDSSAVGWKHRDPASLGMNPQLLAAAVEWASKQETNMPPDFSTQEETFGRPMGPVPTTRAATNGMILRHGYIVAEWGDTRAVDPSYSIAKSYLSTLLGLAINRGLITSVDARVGETIRDGGYDSPHNAPITWAHHVTQTSEWSGEMFGKSHTFEGRAEYGRSAMRPRELRAPGTFYEYNDVRINRFSLSLLRTFERPLPDVLKTEIMDKIGATDTWKYIPYDNSLVSVDMKGVPTPMYSVGGGTRWGGGLWMSTRDHARFGLLASRDGQWNGSSIVSKEWFAEAHSQKGVNPGYGYLWWLNSATPPNGPMWPGSPTTCFSAQGAGSNTIWIDPEHDLVVVWRWHRGDAQTEFYKRILACMQADSGK